jgi:O-succinylbenzoic acid--CoA ligase
VIGEVGGDWLGERARRTPARLAVSLDAERLDYATLDARVSALAHALRGDGIAPGDILAVCLHNGLPAVLLAHAARRCGAILLPINTRLRPAEVAFSLGDAEARRLIHDADTLDLAAPAADDAGVATRAFEDLDRPGARRAGSASARDDASAPSTLLYTSGTTGRPKGALLSPRNFFSSAIASALHLGALPEDRWLACMPLFHVGGLSILWRSVLYGSAALVHDRFDPERVSRAFDEDGVTIVSLTATMLSRVLDARGSRPKPAALRFVLLGGGPCPEPLLARARDAGLPIAPTYGLTEAASQVATRRPDAPQGSGAAPLAGTELRIAGENDRWLGPDEVGEICVRSATVMTGYWRRPDATAEALRGGWLRTGDVGRLDASGGLHVIDRRSDLIVSGGENIYPAEVESVLLAHPDVAEVGVAGVPDPTWGARPSAWWVARPGAGADAASLARFCRERLAGYKVPVAFWRVDALPRTAAGKLRRHALRAESNQPHLAPGATAQRPRS